MGSPLNHMSELILAGFQTNDALFKATHVQRIDGILQANADDRKNTDGIWAKGNTVKHAARLDLATALELQRNGILSDPVAFFAWLELNPQYKVVNKRFSKNRITPYTKKG